MTLRCVFAILLITSAIPLQSAEQAKTKQSSPAAARADRQKQSDKWVVEFLKSESEGLKWFGESGVFAALERKYGKGKVPCAVYDRARNKFFEDIVRPRMLKEGKSLTIAEQEFMNMRASDLPTTGILKKQRTGCTE